MRLTITCPTVMTFKYHIRTHHTHINTQVWLINHYPGRIHFNKQFYYLLLEVLERIKYNQPKISISDTELIYYNSWLQDKVKSFFVKLSLYTIVLSNHEKSSYSGLFPKTDHLSHKVLKNALIEFPKKGDDNDKRRAMFATVETREK